VLSEIRIESLGAIKAANAEFNRGLTVLTGETGTGKTMVVTGLHLLGGARADANRVRSGSDRAVVEGRFTTAEISAGSLGAGPPRAPPREHLHRSSRQQVPAAGHRLARPRRTGGAEDRHHSRPGLHGHPAPQR